MWEGLRNKYSKLSTMRMTRALIWKMRNQKIRNLLRKSHEAAANNAKQADGSLGLRLTLVLIGSLLLVLMQNGLLRLLIYHVLYGSLLVHRHRVVNKGSRFAAVRFVAVPAVRIHCTLCSCIHRALCLAFVSTVFAHSKLRMPTPFSAYLPH